MGRRGGYNRPVEAPPSPAARPPVAGLWREVFALLSPMQCRGAEEAGCALQLPGFISDLPGLPEAEQQTQPPRLPGNLRGAQQMLLPEESEGLQGLGSGEGSCCLAGPGQLQAGGVGDRAETQGVGWPRTPPAEGDSWPRPLGEGHKQKGQAWGLASPEEGAPHPPTRRPGPWLTGGARRRGRTQLSPT